MTLGTPTFSSPQWRDLNATRRYPFSDASSLELVTGGAIPNSTIIDARLYIPGSSGVISLLSVEATGTQVILTIGKFSDARLRATATIALDDPRETIPIRSTSGSTCGILVAGVNQWAEITGLDKGIHELIPGTSDFVPAVVVSVPLNTQRVLGPNGETLGDVVRLVGENGVRLACGLDGETHVIQVHAVGDPLYQAENCDVAFAQANQVIERVVFQSGDTLVECEPDDHGRIFVLPATYDRDDAALRVHTQDDGLRFSLAGKPLHRS